MARAQLARGATGRILTMPITTADGKRTVIPEDRRKGPDKIKPDGWRATARLRLPDGSRVDVNRFRRTQAAAEAALRAAVKDIVDSGPRKPVADSTVAALADGWIDSIRDDTRLAVRTRELYAGTVRRYIRERPFGKLYVDQVTAGDVEDHLNEIAEEVGDGTAKTCRSVLKNVFQRAVRYELVTRNPVAMAGPIAKRGKKKGPERDHARAMTLKEVRSLVSHAVRDPAYNHYGLDLADLVVTMLSTSARIGEALAIRWQDVDLGREPTVSISGTISRAAGKGLVRSTTKTRSSQRDVPLSPRMVAMLRRRRGRFRPEANSPVFPAQRVGTWRDPSNVNKQVRRLLDELDFDWVTPHTFRRTVLTHLGDLGVPLRQVADIAGHANPAMTARHYLGRRGTNEELRRALSSVDFA